MYAITRLLRHFGPLLQRFVILFMLLCASLAVLFNIASSATRCGHAQEISQVADAARSSRGREDSASEERNTNGVAHAVGNHAKPAKPRQGRPDLSKLTPHPNARRTVPPMGLFRFGFVEAQQVVGTVPTTRIYLRDEVPLKDLAELFEFNTGDIRIAPNSSPATPAAHVVVGGGLCYFRHHPGAPKADDSDPEAIVDAIVHLFEQEAAQRVQFLPLKRDDPCFAIITRTVEQSRRRHPVDSKTDDGILGLRVLDLRLEIAGKAMRKLFPQHRFFFYQWGDDTARARSLGRDTQTGFSHRTGCIAVTEKQEVIEFGCTNGCGSFGEFLAGNAVRITNTEDAQLVWDALCEFTGLEPAAGRAERVSERLWRLGVTECQPAGAGRSEYCVELSEDLVVESAKWVVE